MIYHCQLWTMMVNHEIPTMKYHGWPWTGMLVCSFNGTMFFLPWYIMIDHGISWSIIVNHGEFQQWNYNVAPTLPQCSIKSGAQCCNSTKLQCCGNVAIGHLLKVTKIWIRHILGSFATLSSISTVKHSHLQIFLSNITYHGSPTER